VHTFLYAAFLEDPLMWTLLAVGTGSRPPAGPGAAAVAASPTLARRR